MIFICIVSLKFNILLMRQVKPEELLHTSHERFKTLLLCINRIQSIPKDMRKCLWEQLIQKESIFCVCLESDPYDKEKKCTLCEQVTTKEICISCYIDNNFHNKNTCNICFRPFSKIFKGDIHLDRTKSFLNKINLSLIRPFNNKERIRARKAIQQINNSYFLNRLEMYSLEYEYKYIKDEETGILVRTKVKRNYMFFNMKKDLNFDSLYPSIIPSSFPSLSFPSLSSFPSPFLSSTLCTILPYISNKLDKKKKKNPNIKKKILIKNTPFFKVKGKKKFNSGR